MKNLKKHLDIIFFIFSNVLINFEDFDITGESFKVEKAVDENIVDIKNNILNQKV